MGFFDTLGKVAKGAVNAAKETHEQAEQYANQFEYESDEFLVRTSTRSGPMGKRMGAAKVLRRRYPNENERKLIIERYR